MSMLGTMAGAAGTTTGMTASGPVLVTGSLGCLGAWTLCHLVRAGASVVSFDLGEDRRRLDLLMERTEQESITFVRGDITDYQAVLAVMKEHGVERVIHLAALQIPLCKAKPVTGARVNVVGTVNVLEAAREAGIGHVAYASSTAAHGGSGEDGQGGPDTLYGVYKQANEGTARVYWRDHGLSSIGLRPYTVYGVGRDQGLTSDPTKAMLAAAAGQPFEIAFGGRMQFHFASDVAQQFIEASATAHEEARVFDLGTPPLPVAEVVEMISAARPGSRISHVEKPLPFPEGFDAGELKRYLPKTNETPIDQGIEQTIAHFEELLAAGRISELRSD